MEEATKTDLKALELRLQAIDTQIEALEDMMDGCTVGEYTAIAQRINALQIKRMAVNDAINRITNKNFSKNVPDRQFTVSVVTQNRFQK